MARLQPRDVPVRDPAAQLVELPGGRLLVRHGSGLSLLANVRRSELAGLLDRVDGERTVAEIVAGAPDPQRARELLEALAGIAFAQLCRPGAPMIYGHFLAAVSMRSGAPMAGTPELVVGPEEIVLGELHHD